MRNKNKPRIAIFLHHPECSAQCAVGMYEALSSDFAVDMFHTDQIKLNVFKKADIVAFPGGIGDSDTFFKYLAPKADYVREAVYYGKRYLGICMGAYWAAHRYFDLVEGFDAVQYIKRPYSGIRRSFGTTIPVTWNKKTTDMYFYDGCALIGNERKFTTIARYKNDDPMAVIQDNIGLIGCHPESMRSWYDRKSMVSKWHRYQHHKLLLDFAKKLMKN